MCSSNFTMIYSLRCRLWYLNFFHLVTLKSTIRNYSVTISIRSCWFHWPLIDMSQVEMCLLSVNAPQHKWKEHHFKYRFYWFYWSNFNLFYQILNKISCKLISCKKRNENFFVYKQLNVSDVYEFLNKIKRWVALKFDNFFL